MTPLSPAQEGDSFVLDPKAFKKANQARGEEIAQRRNKHPNRYVSPQDAAAALERAILTYIRNDARLTGKKGE